SGTKQHSNSGGGLASEAGRTTHQLALTADVGSLAENPVPKLVRAWMDTYGIVEERIHLITECVINCQFAEHWYKHHLRWSLE
nr:hypothetical protein [Tanacetum cinerariifolium]